MSARFVLRAANGQEHEISGPFRIGRDAQCEIVIDNNLVSRIHASIWIDGDHLLLRDEGSRNGTQVNGRAVAAGEPHYLHAGDKVRIADTTFVVESDQPSAAAGQSQADFEPPATARISASGPPRASEPGPAPPRRPPAWLLAIGGCLALALLAICCALGFFAATAGGPVIATALAPPAHQSPTPAPPAAYSLQIAAPGSENGVGRFCLCKIGECGGGVSECVSACV